MKHRQFLRDERGSAAMILALCLLVLMMFIGAAVDFSRVRTVTTQVQSALDSAALSTGKLRMSDDPGEAVLLQHATGMFKANMLRHAKGSACAEAPVKLTVQEDAIEVSAKCGVPTLLLGLAGIEKIDVEENAGAHTELGAIEIAMMLDVSGSMSGAPIEALKGAANMAVDTLLAEGHGRVRIGLAPYSTSVNAGPFVEVATNGPKKADRVQPECVSERKGGNAFKAKSPKKGGGGVGYDAEHCPKDPVVPLTKDAALLHAEINDLVAEGATAGHLGIAWTWYVLSPDWDTIWPDGSEPAEYSDKKTRKIAILMTDGAFNTEYAPSQGNSVKQAEELCNNMKEDGVIVYAVGFAAPPEARAILSYCASSAEQFFEPESPAELQETYKSIVDDIAQVYLMR